MLTTHMDKARFTKELQEAGIAFTKVRFYAKSPYQAKRYKPEYVGWEAWVYKTTTAHGIVIVEEDWKENKDDALEMLRNC